MSTSLTPVIFTINRLLHLSVILPIIIPIVIDLWSQHIDVKSVRSQNWNKHYDIIIVGAGTAGSILANQVIHNTKYSVLLLEAGGNQNFLFETPALSHLLRSASSLDWQFVTEPQENACFGLNDHRSRWSTGKVVGGSSAIGHMIYSNGNPEDYGQWPKGWAWDDVRKEFPLWEKVFYDKKMTKEDIEDDVERRIEETLSVGSFINKPLMSAFKQSVRQLGYNFKKFNTKSEIGFSHPVLAINKGSINL